jgi:hypothetical protein
MQLLFVTSQHLYTPILPVANLTRGNIFCSALRLAQCKDERFDVEKLAYTFHARYVQFQDLPPTALIAVRQLAPIESDSPV